MPVNDVMSVVATKIYPALLVVFFFALTIFIHELGHFLMARRRGMKVERFSIGFGPKIFGWQKDGIDYRVSWLPFGGYVALPQMSPMEAIEGKTESKAEDLPPAPPASKILVAFAGPVMNILLAFLLASIIWYIGKPSNPAVVGWVEAGSTEEQAGVQPGDRIVKVNGHPIKTWTQFVESVAFSREPQVHLVLDRDGQTLERDLETKLNKQFGVKTLDGVYPRERPFARSINGGSPAERAGLQPGDRFVSVEEMPIHSSDQLRELIGKRADQVTTVKVLRQDEMLTLTVTPEFMKEENAARMGVLLGDELEIVRPGPTPWEQFREVFVSMARMFSALWHSKETGVSAHSVSGPVGIMGAWWYGIVSGGVRQGIVIAILLNINLAILNLLPLPILDGGHIVFAMLESVRRKPLNARLVQNVSVAFAILLISFMLYVTFFDVQRFFSRPKANPGPPTPEAPATAP